MRSSIVLVLAGLSIMVAGLGSAQAPARTPLTPENARTPMSLAVGMSNNFAMELYRRLAKEQPKDNLFFSPYSIVSALAMAVEGARGETTQQMGMVLQFPQEARHVGNDTSLLPWNTALIHTALAGLQQRVLGASADTAQTQALRDRVAHLEQEHQTLTQQFAQLSFPQQRDSQEGRTIMQRDEGVVQELNTLRQQLDPYELRMANALWGEHTFPLRQQFVDTLQSAYGAAAFAADFHRFPEEARQRINHWVAQHTRERIRDLFPQGIIDSNTRLILANAVYFKGNWAAPFDKQQTQEAAFTRQDSTQTPVQLMTTQHEFRYAELFPDGTRNEGEWVRSSVPGSEGLEYTLRPNPRGFQVLELPYRGRTLAMVILLPKQLEGLPTLEQHLTSETLSTWLATLQTQKANVFLPRYHLETTYELSMTLSKMGMPAAFQPGGFTGVSDSPEARALCISAVMHKTFVEVNEEGTEAAAATGVQIMRVSLPPPPPTFRADHPFLFLIRDTQSGTVLFLGRMMDPQQ